MIIIGDIIFSVFPNENFVDLGLYQFGWEQCSSLHSYGPFVRNHYLFHYIISGAGTLMSTGSDGITRTFHVKSGQGFMIFPKQITTYYADEQHPWEYTWLEFDGLRVKEAIELAGFTMNSPIYHANAKDICMDMSNEMLYIANHSDESPFHLIGHLYLFLDFLTRSSSSRRTIQGGKMRDFYIKEAISFIEQNFQNNITIEEIAVFCNLNRSYFGKIFHDALGKSPQEFLISYRMTKATELLKLTELSIGDIGNAIGYESQLHFSRAFRKTYGLSPREWRKENKSYGKVDC